MREQNKIFRKQIRDKSFIYSIYCIFCLITGKPFKLQLFFQLLL